MLHQINYNVIQKCTFYNTVITMYVMVQGIFSTLYIVMTGKRGFSIYRW